MSALNLRIQRAADVCREDETSISLMTFKRTVLRALESPEYDDDLASRLDDAVERRAVDQLDAFMTGRKAEPAEAESRLRSEVERITSEVETILETQGERDIERLARNGAALSGRRS